MLKYRSLIYRFKVVVLKLQFKYIVQLANTYSDPTLSSKNIYPLLIFQSILNYHPKNKMAFLQEMAFLPVVGVIKTLHYFERAAMELSEEPTNTVQDVKEKNSNENNPSITITDVTEIDLTEIEDDIEEKFYNNKGNLRRSSTCSSQGNSRRSSVYDSEGNSRRSSVFDSQKSSRRSSQNDNLEKDLDQQLQLEADFFIKAFPRRALPSYVSHTLSTDLQRQRKSTSGF